MEKERNIDGGFAWLILCASFTVTFLSGMLVYSTGVTNTAILEEIDNDISRTSWIGSTMLATFTLTGPIAGFLTKTLGYRVSCFCGGIFSLGGLFAASFVNDVTGLILTYGVITGFGIGLGLSSSQVVPGYYFRKRRGLAYGVAASGAGMGMFAGGPLVRFLVSEYRLRGCLLIIGAISSNMCVAASLMRPVNKSKRQNCDENKNGLPMSTPVLSGDQKNDTLEECQHKDSFHQDGDILEIIIEKDITANLLSDDDQKATMKENADLQGRHVASSDENISLLDTTCTDTHINKGCDTEERKHIAIGHLHGRNTISKDSKTCTCCHDKLCPRICFGNRPRPLKGFTIVNKYGFLCFCVSVLFWSMGDGAALFHLPNYAELKGSTKAQSANLFTVMGLTSLTSRLLAGFAANDASVGFLIMHIGLVGMAGMVTLLFPMYSNSFTLQLVYSALYGLYSGGPNALMTPLTIDIVGLELLPVGIGIEYFFCGVGYLVGPPLASLIYKATKNYDFAFVFAGGVLLMASLVGAVMGLFESRSQHPPRPDRQREIVVETESKQ